MAYRGVVVVRMRQLGSPRLPDGSWSLVGLPAVSGTAGSRRDAPDAAIAAIAAVLEVKPDSFDLE